MGRSDQVTELASGTFRVTDGHVNAYLVTDGPSITLIDTGFPWERQRFERACVRVGRRPSDVEAVLLTHAHGDHMGGAEHFRSRHGAAVRTHTDEVELATGTNPLIGSWKLVPKFLSHLGRVHTLLFFMHAGTRGFLFVKGVDEVVPFGDGETLDVPGAPTTIHTPGHTSGHAAFHLPERGVLCSGDALVTRNVLTGEGGPQLMPDAVQSDPVRARRSLERLVDRDADGVLPGHGDPFHGTPAEAVAQAERHADRVAGEERGAGRPRTRRR